MTPFMDKKGGASFILDRRYPVVGRIKRATGTSDKRTFRAILAAFDSLVKRERFDVLREVQAGRLSCLDVLSAVQENRVESLPVGSTMLPLIPTMTAWAETAQVAADTRQMYESAIRKLTEAKRGMPMVAELPALVRSVRERSRLDGHPVAFNRFRSAAQAFARDTLGRHSALWLEIAAVPTLKPALKQERPFFSYADVARITDALPAPWDGAVWTMAKTGMGPSEYVGTWKIEADRVHILGTKRLHRVRDVPILAAPFDHYQRWTGTTNADWLREQFRKVAKPACEQAGTPLLQLYDLRRTFARWMEAAGIAETHQALYMGHAAASVTAGYKRSAVTPFIQADAALLTAYLTAQAAAFKNPVKLVSEAKS